MKKIVSLILAGLLLTSCTSEPAVDPVTGETIGQPDKITESDSDESPAETRPEEIVTRTTHLTGIFELEKFPQIGKNSYGRYYPVTYNEDGTFRVYGTVRDGDNKTSGLLTVNSEGEVLDLMPVQEYNRDGFWKMAASEDTVYYTQRKPGASAGGYITACGAHHTGKLLDISDLFADTAFHGFDMMALRLDGDGNVYLCTELEVAVFDPDLNLKFMLRPDGGITAMNTDQNGVVYIASGEGDSYGLYPIDAEKKALGTPNLLGSLRIENLFFADGYDFYYTDHKTAVYGAYFPSKEGGQPWITEVMSFNNSGISNMTFTLLNVIDSETIVGLDTWPGNVSAATPILFRKVPDRPLEGITVIEAAYTTSSQYFEADVMEFNRTHDDIMVVLQNYARFNNAIEPDAGETRLAMDVMTGVYVPDIILGTYDQPVVKTIVDQGAYVDLNTCLAEDSVVSEDTVMPSILYSYSTDDGKLWGLPANFEVSTVVGNRALTGDITQWTLTGLLDFAEKLPAGTSLMDGLSQSNAIEGLLGINAFASFVNPDAGTCSFDDGDFARLLELIRSLPKSVNTDERSEESIDARLSGTVALHPKRVSSADDMIDMEAIFGTKDVSVIGFPVSGSDKGSQLYCSESFTLLSSSENPDAAWEFIRFMLSDEYVFSHDTRRPYGYSILKDRCRESIETILGKIHDFAFELGTSSAGWSSIAEERPMKFPGVRVIPTQADVDALIDYLANDVGHRIVNRIPDEITDIVKEEIATYLTGVKDARTCADVIQSRVKIWLAEHE